jgi:hypothetical protein
VGSSRRFTNEFVSLRYSVYEIKCKESGRVGNKKYLPGSENAEWVISSKGE